VSTHLLKFAWGLGPSQTYHDSPGQLGKCRLDTILVVSEDATTLGLGQKEFAQNLLTQDNSEHRGILKLLGLHYISSNAFVSGQNVSPRSSHMSQLPGKEITGR
jgi:hypothetical protein